MTRRTDAKDRAVTTAARLFQRQGYHGTGLTQIINESGSPKGSFYFHFPGGKEELAGLAIAASSAEVVALIELAVERHPDDSSRALTFVGRALDAWLVESDFTAGCALATITLDVSHTSQELREKVAASYDEWITAMERLLASGIADHRRRAAVAELAIAALEGALILARSRRDTSTLTRVTAQVLELLDTEATRV